MDPHVAAIVGDPAAMGLLARALILGTPTPEAAPGTSDGAASDQEPQTHSGLNPNERARVLALLKETA